MDPGGLVRLGSNDWIKCRAIIVLDIGHWVRSGVFKDGLEAVFSDPTHGIKVIKTLVGVNCHSLCGHLEVKSELERRYVLVEFGVALSVTGFRTVSWFSSISR